MAQFLAGIYLALIPVLVVWGYFFYKQWDIPLLIVSGLLLLFTGEVVFEIPRFVSLSISYGLKFDFSFVLAIVCTVAGIWGIIRSVKGLMVTILRSDAVLDRWNYVVKQGAGRGDFVLGTIERAIIDTRMPGVGTRREQIAIELFGEKRPFLIVLNTKYKEYKMYINARDFGVDLDVSWYFTASPRFLKRTLSRHATGDPQDLTMRVSLFAQQDISAFKSITHDRVKQTLDMLLEELNLEPSGLNTGSRGFLSVW